MIRLLNTRKSTNIRKKRTIIAIILAAGQQLVGAAFVLG